MIHPLVEMAYLKIMNQQKIKLAIGSDHGGFELKESIKTFFSETRPWIEWVDQGCFSTESVHYPQYASLVARSVLNSESQLGILCCGSGIGVSMMANRFKGIRAAVVFDELTARLCKEHNNANILCLGGRTLPLFFSHKLIEIWLDAQFEEGRHSLRIDQLDQNTFGV